MRTNSPGRSGLRAVAAFLVLLCGGPLSGQLAPLPQDTGANGLALALRRLPVVGRVLYVTAHPDDEHNGVQVRLSRGLGLRVGLLTLTRGEGGQNEIGPELGADLGVLRSEELAAVHRYDGAEQLFGRAYDFGFSFSVDETFRRWGREETLGDVVRALRAFRPDVVLTLPLEAKGGGQHHQAAAQLTREAFRAAADPARFPEQMAAGLRPWQARKLYQGGVGGGLDSMPGSPVTIDTSTFDPLLGMSWQQFGSLARTMHRCQSVGQLEADALTGSGSYWLVDAAPPVGGAESDLLAGIDVSLEGLADWLPEGTQRSSLVPELQALDRDVAAAQAAFDVRSPERCAPPLEAALGKVKEIQARVGALGPGGYEIAFRLAGEERDLGRALALALGLELDAFSEVGDVVPGQSFTVSATVYDQGDRPLADSQTTLRAPRGWVVERVEGADGPIAPRQSRRIRFRVHVADDARLSRPFYHLRAGADRYDIDLPADEGRPWSPPDLVGALRFEAAGGVPAELDVPVVYRYAGRWVGGEKRKVVNLVPALSVRLSPDVSILPVSASPRPVELRASVMGEIAGTAKLRLQTPPGWRAEPAEATLSIARPGQEVVTPFRLYPPSRLGPGEATVEAVASRDGREFTEGFRVVAYEHIQERHVFSRAVSRVVSVRVGVTPGTTVGYVMGTGDSVPESLRALGIPVTLLQEADLAAGDLSRFTTIVTGIRAYQARGDLRSANPRLMRYVEAGGHLVVLYNRLEFNDAAGARPTDASDSPFAPYPGFRVTPERITDETAPPRVVADDPVLHVPNSIGSDDWAGWVQERGLQFARVSDPRYEDVLSFTDPFPQNPGAKGGALVVAAVGKGTWTYVGLALFRQLPAGVPGAYRLLANIVSRPRPR